MILTGILASTNYPKGDYESIATVSVGAGGASDVQFTSIPSTFQHLQIRGIGRAANSVTDENLVLRFNGDTGSNYSLHNVFGNGSTTGANASANTSFSYFMRCTGASSTANRFGVVVCDILDYKDTNKYTTLRSLSGHDQNGSGYVTLMSGSWRNTAAITSITIKNDSAANIAEGSTFALYGIKG